MDAATSKTLDNHSHVVRPAEMEWKKMARVADQTPFLQYHRQREDSSWNRFLWSVSALRHAPPDRHRLP
jgi:hypothetical protein